MPPTLVGMLAAHLAARGLTATDQHELIFVAPEGGPLRYNNWLRRVWQPAVVAAGVPALRFHDLRRTAATAMVAAGVDVRTAQARLGHADPRVTLAIYAQVVSNADRHAAHQLQALLMDPSTRASTNQRRRITDEARCRGARSTRDGRRKGTLGVLAGSGRKWPLTCPNPQPEPTVGIEPTTFALRVRPFSSPSVHAVPEQVLSLPDRPYSPHSPCEIASFPGKIRGTAD